MAQPSSSSPPAYTKVSPTVAKNFKESGSVLSKKKTKDLDGDSWKRRYVESSPNIIDSSGLPLVTPNGDPDDPDPSSSASKSSKKKPKKPKDLNEDDDLTMDEDECPLVPETPDGSIKPSRSKRTREEKDLEEENRLRNKPYVQRLKRASFLQWDGTSANFRVFSTALKGHLIMGGAKYLLSPDFVQLYKEIGPSCIHSRKFWLTFRALHPEAVFDRAMLYWLLMLSMKNQQHKTLMKYDESEDGILTWDELRIENEFNGSRELRLEQLEHEIANLT